MSFSPFLGDSDVFSIFTGWGGVVFVILVTLIHGVVFVILVTLIHGVVFVILVTLIHGVVFVILVTLIHGVGWGRVCYTSHIDSRGGVGSYLLY